MLGAGAGQSAGIAEPGNTMAGSDEPGDSEWAAAEPGDPEFAVGERRDPETALEAIADHPSAVIAELIPLPDPGGDTTIPSATLPTAAVARRTVALVIAEALRAAGVRVAFTVPGESFLGLLEGLVAVGIRVVATRHEGAAAFMAEAHGQLTGRPAACIGTRAVGAANLAIGVHTATADSTPMFVLIGGVERSARGREAFQEVDVVQTIGNLAKWSAEITDPGEVVATMERAIDQALSGRPGPVVLGVPEDVLDEEVSPEVGVQLPRLPKHPGVADDDIRAVLQLLASAERPVILAGGGVLRARCSNDLVRFADLLHVPVIASWRRADVIPNDHPLYLGMAGLGAPSTVRERLARADALLVLGCRLNEWTSYRWTIPAPGIRWAHVDTAPVRPSPELSVADVVVEADARLFLRGAISRLERAVLHAGLVQARDEANGSDREAWEAAAVVDHLPWSGPGVHPGRIVATLARLLPDQAILTTDAGSFAGWASRGYRFRRPGTNLGSTSGAMGYGLPAAIAAALVHRDRPVVALVGDGGLGMTLAELETAVREGARVIVIAFDNEQYAMIRAHQDRRPGGAAIATDLGPIDFAAAARACGARATRVDTDAAFEPALRQALTADVPTVIHLVVDPSWGTIEQATRRAAESGAAGA